MYEVCYDIALGTGLQVSDMYGLQPYTLPCLKAVLSCCLLLVNQVNLSDAYVKWAVCCQDTRVYRKKVFSVTIKLVHTSHCCARQC